jgi:hemerythrin-like domain-containing protein
LAHKEILPFRKRWSGAAVIEPLRIVETQMAERFAANRRFVLAAGAGLVFAGGNAPHGFAAEEKKVGATEDLMREHGVLRRILLVYRESAAQLRSSSARPDPKPLHQAATLFRDFGEEYHEKKLEEAHLFPVIRKAGGPAAADIDVLITQHNRGREITDFILAETRKAAIPDAQRLVGVLDAFALMYQNHAAREDTITFPAWKDALSEHQLDDMAEMFEDIEHQQFGKDGFEDAVKQIGEIETALGFADLAQFTAPPPPKA